MGAVKRVWRTHRHPKAAGEMSAAITMGEQLDNKAVATSVDWPVLKATEAELKGKAKVNLKTDSCSYEIEARECE